MSEPAVKWNGPTKVEPPRALRVAGSDERRLAELRERVRAVGEQWAGAPPVELAELLSTAAADDPELGWLARLGGRLLEDFFVGLSVPSAAPSFRDLGAHLIDGQRLPREVLDRLAPEYVVLVVSSPGDRQDEQFVRELTGRGVLSVRRSGALVLLVPHGDAGLVEKLTRQLSADGWVATAQRRVAELAGGYEEAAEVLRLVAAVDRPHGVYTLDDVLVEHAVTRNPSVVARLVEVIRPLRDNEVMWLTLVALVRADFNRNRAASDLYIHRSTLDYRLRRIAQMTGCDPTSGRGAQMLGAAMIADVVASPAVTSPL